MHATEPKQYWMTPAERAGAPAVERAGELYSDPRTEALQDGEFSRRDFLKLMGISSVLAGAAACAKRPVETIVPYLNRPEEVTPGKAIWYASTAVDGANQVGVLVKTREGRPIKLEGNPDHPLSRGALDATTQAALWNLYDPDRLQQPEWREQRGAKASAVSYADFDARVQAAVRAATAKGQKVRVLTGLGAGPSATRVLRDFVSAQGNAQHVVYESINAEELVWAQAACYGQAVLPRYRFDQAQLVMSLGADFLGTWGTPVSQARDWAATRALLDHRTATMARLVCFEPTLTLTGTNADERFPVRSLDLIKIALGLLHEFVVMRRVATLNEGIPGWLQPYRLSEMAAQTGVPAATLQRLADELWAQRGHALVVGGLLTGGPGRLLQVVINLLNSVLDNDGRSVDWAERPSQLGGGAYADLQTLIGEMQAGEVAVLIMAATNPVYSLPRTSGFTEALTRVGTIIHVTDRADETSVFSHGVIPVSHFLESWGDSEAPAGVYGLMQPTIAPLYDTRTWGAHLLAWQGKAASEAANAAWYDVVRETWRTLVAPAVGSVVPFEVFWQASLRRGVVMAARASAGARPVQVPTEMAEWLRTLFVSDQHQAMRPGQIELVCYPSLALRDGRVANNSWLQELPDPISKITWDNYLNVAPALAQARGWDEGEVVTVQLGSTGDRLVRVPVHIQPGMPKEVVSIALGYGREVAGRVGTGVGVRVHDLGEPHSAGIQWAGLPVQLATTGQRVRLAVTQGHHRVEGRPILQETTFAAFQRDPASGALPHQGPLPSFWAPHAYPGRKWGMAIDLSACTGCSACMIACQVENNLPVVGKQQVFKGREMYWISIHRYYAGSEDNPTVVHQPMLCQHCDKAPCETVCPVLATIHSDEGLNVQVYNRCVGTRYCANNCPYKVRRFNWFDYGARHSPDLAWQSPLEMVLNPDVTVREKGVMEKCTFCIQRIRGAKEEAKRSGQPIPDGRIQTACQQSCPTQAITFGDQHDAQSQVAVRFQDPRGYRVLAELNTLPQVAYLTKVRQVNDIAATSASEPHGT